MIVQLHNQLHRAQQYLSSIRPGQSYDPTSLPREFLDMLIFRVYDLRTVEPFGKIDKMPLTRPITFDRLKLISEQTLEPVHEIMQEGVNFYAPRRQDSLEPRRRNTTDAFEDLDEMKRRQEDADNEARLYHSSSTDYAFEPDEKMYDTPSEKAWMRFWARLGDLLELFAQMGKLARALSPMYPLGNPQIVNTQAWCDLLQPQRGQGWYLGSRYDSALCFVLWEQTSGDSAYSES